MQEYEYVVTLHQHEDLMSFYDDMETAGGSLYIPHREVVLADRRPVSRNTHYMLTKDEATLLRNDPRVLAVDLTLEGRGLSLSPNWTETSAYWNKSNMVNAVLKNWGLLRSVEGESRPDWGSNGTPTVDGTISVTASGKNVDVVIVDGHMDPTHPEFAINVDGTGGSRVVQYNWFNLNPAVTGGTASDYVYTPYVDGANTARTLDNDHGAHVAGIAAGNTHGWAHDANIYNISPYSSSPSSTGYFLDYIKVWHQTKPINPITGIKNPTVTNNSYGLIGKVAIASITSVRINGTTVNGPFTSGQLLAYGIYNSAGFVSYPARDTALEQDFIDLMAAGVIVIGAAGNEYAKINNYNASVTDDYNNYFAVGTTLYYYMRGTITSVPGAICVGAVGTSVNDSKLDISNCGPRIDVYAPGRYIMSAVNSSIGVYVADSRDANYNVTKKTGTSMACPQVAGVVACAAESWPAVKPPQILEYIHTHATTNQITAGTGGRTDYTDLQGSANRFLYFYKSRPNIGQVGPKLNLGNRPSSGQTWPRPKIYRYGR